MNVKYVGNEQIMCLDHIWDKGETKNLTEEEAKRLAGHPLFEVVDTASTEKKSK